MNEIEEIAIQNKEKHDRLLADVCIQTALIEAALQSLRSQLDGQICETNNTRDNTVMVNVLVIRQLTRHLFVLIGDHYGQAWQKQILEMHDACQSEEALSAVAVFKQGVLLAAVCGAPVSISSIALLPDFSDIDRLVSGGLLQLAFYTYGKFPNA